MSLLLAVQGGDVVERDTHDGWWAKQWRKKKKPPEQTFEVLVAELVEEVIQKAKKPKESKEFIPVPLPSTALERTRLIEQILIQLIDDEDEFEMEMLLL